MSYSMSSIPCNKANYGNLRSVSNIKYIVIHFTANDGDKAINNGNYFKNNVVKASAHYFVDDNTVIQSVKDNYVAWAVGGSKYTNCSSTGGGTKYGVVTNSNSISIEMCDTKRDGKVMATERTIENCIELTVKLMKKYKIPSSHVVRHFDVTGKSCPAYYVNNNEWNKFLNKVKKAAGEKIVKIEPKKVNYDVIVTTDNLNVRTSYSTSSESVKKLHTGDKRTIIAEVKNEGLTWGKIKDNRWIALKYTKKC